jgi:hypothetical protein
MKSKTLLRNIVGSVLICSIAAAAQTNGDKADKGMWRASSSTARSITGDVALSEEKIVINFSSFTIARIRALQPAEASALFDADTAAPGNGNLYRLSIPSSKTFLKHNTLCGSEETQWMVSYAAGRSLQLAFFSGPKPPTLTLDALANSSDTCGTYSYVR